jgi:hypothetical protein
MRSLLLAALLLVPGLASGAEAGPPRGYDRLDAFDKLPLLGDSSCHMESSYDRSGGNQEPGQGGTPAVLLRRGDEAAHRRAGDGFLRQD